MLCVLYVSVYPFPRRNRTICYTRCDILRRLPRLLPTRSKSVYVFSLSVLYILVDCGIISVQGYWMKTLGLSHLDCS